MNEAPYTRSIPSHRSMGACCTHPNASPAAMSRHHLFKGHIVELKNARLLPGQR